MPDTGRLQVQVFKEDTYIPLDDVDVTIVESEVNQTTRQVVNKTLKTDSSGQTIEVELKAPPLENSMKPIDKLPYSLVDLKITKPGYKTTLIKGCQVMPNETAVQQCNLPKQGTRQVEQIIDIQANRLVGNFPPKIPEDPNKPDPKPPSGLVVLPEPVVPQYIIVHQGVPDDPSAPNYTLRFKDYIKNVASSEIFSTWPETTIRANVYCILSFTLNRIYTEWYRGKGKKFDITSSTAYDHAFSYGRNIYANISRVVDDIFSSYLKRPGRKQPLLTQYCDGVNVQCPGWLTQWGSKYLGDQGKSPYEILTNFYGKDLNITTAKKVSGIPKSYPGYTLTLGSSGTPVRTIQTYLNRISDDYPSIPKMPVDGVYGKGTKTSVTQFQRIFYLPATGNVDYATWYKISDVYVAVTKIGELGRIKGTVERFFVPPILDRYGENIPTISFFEDED